MTNDYWLNDFLFGAFLFLSFVWKGFIDQHDRDIILDGIEQVAGFADQAISGSIQEDISFTFRTGQNLQELLADRHFRSPFLKQLTWYPLK